jgi:hypothetical protein
MAKTPPLRSGGNEQVLAQIIKPNFGDMLFMVHRGCLGTQAWILVIKIFGPSYWCSPYQHAKLAD